jgi:hypothetical protein
MPAKQVHKWTFRSRFKRDAFGWRSQPAITRIREAVSEIKKAGRKDKVLAAEGAVLFLERVSPAIQHVDSSSGAIGNAVNAAIDILVPIIAEAPAEDKLRSDWLERLWDAVEADDIPYLESLADHWGTLCATAVHAAHWADRFLPVLRMAWGPDRNLHGYFKGTTACLSALHKCGHHEKILELLETAPYKFWPYRCWGVKALVALSRKAEAIKYAEERRELNDSPISIALACEEIILSDGMADQAYSLYAIDANRKATHLATFRAICGKYSHKTPKEILDDLVAASSSSDRGKWFAAAKSAGLYDEAVALANSAPCDPKTLIRAARDNVAVEPGFALEAGMAALRWMAAGYGYEIGMPDVRAAYDYTVAAARRLGCETGTADRIRELAMEQPGSGNLVFVALGRSLGLVAK